MGYYAGIDPGKSGAIALLLDGKALSVWKCPILKQREGPPDYDKPAMREIIDQLWERKAVVYIELQHSFPGQAVQTTFAQAYGYGLWVGILSAYGFSPIVVSPQCWKKEMGVILKRRKGMTKQEKIKAKKLKKAMSVSKAKELGYETTNSDMAEAYLIAKYAERIHVPQ